jgi:hypothetical protein
LLVWVTLLATPAGAHPYTRPAPSDKVSVEASHGVLELSWSDYEERLKGSLSPAPPRAGQPLRVNVHVGSFEGEAFDGPLTITLREEGQTQGDTRTVRRGEANWTVEFLPERSGPHQLDFSFRTTRLKVLHAQVEVAASPVPRMILWSGLGLLTVVAISFGVRSLLREARPAPPPPSTQAPPAEAAPAAEAAAPAAEAVAPAAVPPIEPPAPAPPAPSLESEKKSAP